MLEGLPRRSGVYFFWGSGTLPLYIGKSVDIRSRVLSHIRAEDEAEMMAQTQRIDFIETAGEMGALLLEAHLIKKLCPLYNIRLRRQKTLCSIRLDESGSVLIPEIVSGHDTEIAGADNLYGLFGSVHAAKEKLRELAQQHRLCMGLLGLEKISRRGCFGLQLKTCLGACVGKEDRSAHDQRLRSALQDHKVQAWPYAGAVDLVEQTDGWTQRHRIQGWRFLGTWCSKTNTFTAHERHGFDLDTYKILVRPILLGTLKIEPV
ncbi:excinuclease [Hylemonella gracilis ATCC 19624]|uniref:Excinuclease cho n=2 Tax=Hylemonella gracilis TaxID=80880 RepID=F3KUI0_9BURK|nr:excinuclease [Hylemonella gracilis ATCC 19624]